MKLIFPKTYFQSHIIPINFYTWTHNFSLLLTTRSQKNQFSQWLYQTGLTSRSKLYEPKIFKSFSCIFRESLNPKRQSFPCQLQELELLLQSATKDKYFNITDKYGTACIELDIGKIYPEIIWILWKAAFIHQMYKRLALDGYISTSAHTRAKEKSMTRCSYGDYLIQG